MVSTDLTSFSSWLKQGVINNIKITKKNTEHFIIYVLLTTSVTPAYAEPLIGSIAIGFEVGAERRFAAKVAAHPATALPYFPLRVIGIRIPVPVHAPFPYISRHIIQP